MGFSAGGSVTMAGLSFTPESRPDLCGPDLCVSRSDRRSEGA